MDTLKFGDLIAHVTDDGYRVDIVEERAPHWYIQEWDLITDQRVTKRELSDEDVKKALWLACELAIRISSFLWEGVESCLIGDCTFRHMRGRGYQYELIAPKWSQRLADIVTVAVTISGLCLWDSHACHSGWRFWLVYRESDTPSQN